MPNEYYGKMWIATADQLNDVLLQEQVVQKMKPTQNRKRAHRIFASLFIRYINLCNNLGLMYDQTLQAQKSVVVQNLLEAATNRMLELNNELKEIEFSEFTYFDNVLIENKLTPYDVQYIVPFYYPMERAINIQNLIDGIESKSSENLTFTERMQSMYDTEVATSKPAPTIVFEKMVVNEEEQKEVQAVNLIKAHEKARQGRVCATNLRLHPDKFKQEDSDSDSDYEKYEFYHKPDQAMYIPIHRTVYSMDFYQRGYHLVQRRKTNKVDEDEELKKTPEEIAEENRAAFIIQRAYKNYKINEAKKELEIKKGRILGMIGGKKVDKNIEKNIRKERKVNSRRKIKFVMELEKAILNEKARILKIKTPWIMEDITDHIRYWFREMYNAGGQLDTFPPEAKGGTLLVIKGLTPTPEEFPQALKEREANAKMSKEEKAKIKLEAKKLKAAEKLKRKLQKAKEKLAKKLAAQQAAKEGKTWNFRNEEFITKNFINLKETMQEYEKKWYFIDEMKNVKDDPIMEWITDDKYAEVHVELRPLVDEFMRLEYELLRMAWCQDNKKRYKAPKVKKAKNKKGKKGKKKRQPKDITADRTVADLYSEMVETGLIMHQYPKVDLEDFIGDFNYGAYELRHLLEQYPPHFMGDVRGVLRGWTFGMSSIATKKPRSICIAGPPLSGKKLLAFALASEMDAVIMNLSPDVVIQYNGKMNYFVHLVTKMSRILQPTVLFIDGANKPFIKKCPPLLRPLNPKMLGKVLFKKIVKPIKPVDRVMLIGTTNEPWNAPPAKMRKAFERTILVPAVDYGSAYLCWREGCLKYHAVNPTLDFSSLAMVSQKYTSGLILKAAEEVLNIYRRMDLPKKPLKMDELINGLLYGTEPPMCFEMTEKILKKYEKWFAKANKLQKKQVKMRKELEAKMKPKKK